MDENKDKENQTKHDVPFSSAQYVFLDPHRIIAEDIPTPTKTSCRMILP